MEDNADIVQQIAIFAGFGCTYSIIEDNRKDIFSNIHSLHITDKNVVNGQAVKSAVEGYNGKIYCVQVPTGMIIVRRNKKAVICGNSGEPVEVVTHGRHDPCVGIRATPIAEAMLALVLMDHLLRHRAQNRDVQSQTPVIPAAAE